MEGLGDGGTGRWRDWEMEGERKSREYRTKLTFRTK
jgi:hypothetical protein